MEMKKVLETLISNGVQILVIDQDDEKLISLIRERIHSRNANTIEVWHCIEERIPFSGERLLTKKQMERVLELYHLYDFSDKVTVLSSNVQYASMVNYVKTGLLTMEGMVEALLGK